jgi:hypothetical protein
MIEALSPRRLKDSPVLGVRGRLDPLGIGHSDSWSILFTLTAVRISKANHGREGSGLRGGVEPGSQPRFLLPRCGALPTRARELKTMGGVRRALVGAARNKVRSLHDSVRRNGISEASFPRDVRGCLASRPTRHNHVVGL